MKSNFSIKLKRFSILSIAALSLWSCETDDITLPDASTVSATLSATPITMAEDGGTSTVKVTLSKYAFTQVDIKLSFEGTATNGTDYTISSENITIATGQKEGTIKLKGLDDSVFEGNETISVKIASITNAVSDGSQADITIKEGLSVNPLLINEVLYDPSNNKLDGDANGDGIYNQDQDEFIELVNNSSKPLDISGYKIYDATALTANTPRHIFPTGTIIPAGKAIVVFGGGTPTGTFGGATVQKASGGLLNLNNDSDFITITDSKDATLLTFDVTPLSDNPNEAYTRKPDLTGDFVQHSTVSKTTLFSPGKKIDLTNF